MKNLKQAELSTIFDYNKGTIVCLILFQLLYIKVVILLRLDKYFHFIH